MTRCAAGTGVKAVVYDRYGSPDVLRVEDVPVPSPGAGQVRVKVAAVSVNLSDWECLRGSPAYARIGGLRVSGAPDAGIGHRRASSTRSGKGSPGSGPETRCTATTSRSRVASRSTRVAPESALAHKPAELTFAEASTIPQAGAIALQGTAGRGAGAAC